MLSLKTSKVWSELYSGLLVWEKSQLIHHISSFPCYLCGCVLFYDSVLFMLEVCFNFFKFCFNFQLKIMFKLLVYLHLKFFEIFFIKGLPLNRKSEEGVGSLWSRTETWNKVTGVGDDQSQIMVALGQGQVKKNIGVGLCGARVKVVVGVLQ